MTWLSLDDAFSKIMKKKDCKSKGVHVFHCRRKNMFEVIGTSRRNSVVDIKINGDHESYVGFYNVDGVKEDIRNDLEAVRTQ